MPDIPQTRQSLLIELGRRSGDAWTEFLEVYESAIYRQCRAKGLQDADARDVTQEVLAAVHQKIATWDHDRSQGSFRGWLMQVARNISVDSIRKRARHHLESGGTQNEQMLHELEDRGIPDDEAFDLEYSRSLFSWAAERVKGEVRPVTWKAFHLTSVEELSATDAAARLGITVGSVYTAKCRVVARIRDRIKELESKP